MSGSDNWAGAPTLAASGSTTVDNTGFTSEASEPIPVNGPGDGPWQSVWWKWVADFDGTLEVSLQGSRLADTSGMDTVLAVYTGASLAGLTEVASNDDAGFGGDPAPGFTGDDSLNSRIRCDVSTGITYYFQASGYDASNFGDVHLAWARQTPSDTPVMTGQAPGITGSRIDNTYTFFDTSDLTIALTWTETSQSASEVQVGGLSATGDGVVTNSTLTRDITFANGLFGSATIKLRTKQTGKGWSDWASLPVQITDNAFGLLPNDSTFDPGDPGPVNPGDFMVGYWWVGHEFSLDRVTTPTPVAGTGVMRATVIDASNLQEGPLFAGDADVGPYFALPGDEITVSVWVRADPGNAHVGLYQAALTVRALSSSHGSLGSWEATIGDGYYPNYWLIDESAWALLPVTATMPAGTHWVTAVFDVRWYNAPAGSPLGGDLTNGDIFYFSDALANLRHPSEPPSGMGFVLGMTTFN
jgi:hypothetical protein